MIRALAIRLVRRMARALDIDCSQWPTRCTVRVGSDGHRTLCIRCDLAHHDQVVANIDLPDVEGGEA